MKEYEFNPNDIEHCLERADALKAFESEEDIQRMNFQTGEWRDLIIALKETEFNPDLRYRRKPTPVARRWSRKADIPAPICWVRRKGDVGNLGLETMIASRSDAGFELYNNGERFISFTKPEMIDALEHSTDCVNWSDLTTLEP